MSEDIEVLNLTGIDTDVLYWVVLRNGAYFAKRLPNYDGHRESTFRLSPKEAEHLLAIDPNDAPLTGEALAVSCDSPFGAYRQRLETLAAKNWPKTRAKIGAYYRAHGHLLGGGGKTKRANTTTYA